MNLDAILENADWTKTTPDFPGWEQWAADNPKMPAAYLPGQIVGAGWDESEHPRHPEGSTEGGQFAPKTTSAPLSGEAKEALRGYREGLSRASDMGYLDQTHLSGHFMNKLLRGRMFDEEAAQYLYQDVWNNGVPNPKAPVYKKEWPRAVENVAIARKNIKLLDKAIADSVLQEDYVVYRGMNFPGDAIAPNDPRRRIRQKEDPEWFVGKKFTDRGFTATTYDPEVARKFREGMVKGWTLRFTVPKGTPALLVKENGLKSGLSDFKSESELLLGRGHSFVVKAVDPGPRIMDLELVKKK